jgi:hypothetical protein
VWTPERDFCCLICWLGVIPVDPAGPADPVRGCPAGPCPCPWDNLVCWLGVRPPRVWGELLKEEPPELIINPPESVPHLLCQLEKN